MKHHNEEESVESLSLSLKQTMDRELRLLRELLGNMQWEQQVHLHNSHTELKAILSQRDPIVKTLAELRDSRLTTLEKLAVLAGDTWDPDLHDNHSQSLRKSLEHVGDMHCEITLVRDQLLAVLEQIQHANERNNYLIRNKVKHTKDLLNTIRPGSNSTTYGKKGMVRVKTATLPVVNQEV